MKSKVFAFAVILGLAGYAAFVASFFTDYSMFDDPRWINLAVGVLGTVGAIVFRP